MLALSILFCLIAGTFTQSASAESRSSSSASSLSYSSPLTDVPPPPVIDGPCPNIIGEAPDFNLMVGPWYEVQRSANNWDGSDKCSRFVWNEPMNNSSKLIYNAASNLAPMTSKTISVAVPNNEGVAFTYYIPIVGKIVKQRIFLDTNYDDHLILYTCEEIGDQHKEIASIYSRQPIAGPKMDMIKRDAFARYNLNVPVMVYLDNSNCDLYYDSYDAEKFC